MRSVPRRLRAPGASPVMAAFWTSRVCAPWRRCIFQTKNLTQKPTSPRTAFETDRSHGRQDSDRRSARVRLLNPATLETTMQVVADRAEAPTVIQPDLRAIFVSLELSRSTWLITSLSPG